jgi:hypothetical protein
MPSRRETTARLESPECSSLDGCDIGCRQPTAVPWFAYNERTHPALCSDPPGQLASRIILVDSGSTDTRRSPPATRCASFTLTPARTFWPVVEPGLPEAAARS